MQTNYSLEAFPPQAGPVQGRGHAGGEYRPPETHPRPPLITPCRAGSRTLLRHILLFPLVFPAFRHEGVGGAGDAHTVPLSCNLASPVPRKMNISMVFFLKERVPSCSANTLHNYTSTSLHLSACR
ncbi:hypothetical protein E2C01_089279 [Portunus trituberculatus]|uniref:Uncharacterized protein n=1 Tax=Portunus trituberculatus TaxID=210409 RepID=A0A5B7JLT8_PORTR|nr:hypothetical protein [Portunus trituberculatus]